MQANGRMVIAAQKVVSFHYTLHDDKGELLDRSGEGEPMLYLHGESNIVPGLEREMEGKKVGDKFDVGVAAADGYGERQGDALAVPRADFPEEVEIREGAMIVAESEEGQFPLWIVGIAEDAITVDPNHPLAGVDLHFAVEVAEIRDATEEEIAHGHPHGPGGHHHH
jgi:FKBP-type peptidyl-prolyl cis-trans isomerase SlyD